MTLLHPPTPTSAPPCPPGWKRPNLVAWPFSSPLGRAGTPAVLSKAQPSSTELSLGGGYLGPPDAGLAQAVGPCLHQECTERLPLPTQVEECSGPPSGIPPGLAPLGAELCLCAQWYQCSRVSSLGNGVHCSKSISSMSAQSSSLEAQILKTFQPPTAGL